MQREYPGYTTFFNVDDFYGSTIKYQTATFRAFGLKNLDPPQPQERISIRYANGSNFARHMALKRVVPGAGDVVVLPNIVFPPTGGWSTWANEEFYFADVGNHGQLIPNLKLVSLTDEGGPNVQWIKVEFAFDSCIYGSCTSYSLSTGGSVSCN